MHPQCCQCKTPYKVPDVIYDTREAQRFDLHLCRDCWQRSLDDYERDVANRIPTEP